MAFFVLFVPMDSEIHKILMNKAGALLARRSYTRGELREKLAKYSGGAPVEPVLDRLEQLSLLNDGDYAYNFAFYKIRQEGWAPAKVQSFLLRRKIDQKLIESAVERVRSEPGDESDLVRFVQKHCKKAGLPQSPREIRRLIVFLRRRGYEDDRILDTLRQLLPHEAWQKFETGE